MSWLDAGIAERATDGPRCTSCGEHMGRPSDHNCGFVSIPRDRLRTLLEAEAAARSLPSMPDHNAA